MKILFTGASSFTGFWFVKALTAAGHEVTATFRQKLGEYSDQPRADRVSLLTSTCRSRWETSFGDEKFFDLLSEGGWDLLCHHAADVSNYRSLDFDVGRAVANNTCQLRRVLKELKGSGCRGVILTGSVFENDEGAGSEPLAAFSPYGLSKSFTWQMVRFFCEQEGVKAGKFVIPNPFGPYEDARFTAYLMKTWFAGGTASVKTPEYIRDNIHVSLLAHSYVRYCESFPEAVSKLNPSGYVETQGAFALRVASAMRQRLRLSCDLELSEQSEFAEPYCRINTDRVEASSGWSESEAWNEFAAFYQMRFG